MSTEAPPIPAGWQEMIDNRNWSDQEIEAFRVMRNARPGDSVIFADRSMAMEVEETGTDEDGNRYLEVAKPRADGTYTVRERYKNDKPKYSSDVGRANDLEWVDREPEPREITEQDYEELAERLIENALDAFMRLDYGDWSDAVTDVVEDWSEDVAFERWKGYRHHPDWEDGDAEAIFESVVDHADTVPEDHEDGDLSPRDRAEIVLYERIFTEGRQQAEDSIITDESDYRDIADMLAHHSIDRYNRKNYSMARIAVNDTVSNWLDDRGEPAYQSIIEYGNNRFDDSDYDHYDDSVEEARERAFDILNHDVWERVQEYQRQEGEHDPTVRGLTATDYGELVDVLGMRAARRYTGEGFLRTTAKDVVDDWADKVQAEEWSGHRHRVYAAGDVEDIFASVALHATANPHVWNPFSSNRERKLAVQAITPEVVTQAETVVDKNQAQADPVPAEEYVQDTLGLDKSWDDFTAADPDSAKETAERVVEAADGDEVGWTFAEEILESGGRIPESTNDWVLVDYGVIRQGDTLRKLAWFNRANGNVLALSGQANAEPFDLADADQPYQGFHVTMFRYDEDAPTMLLSDVGLQEALDYVYERIGANEADFRVITDKDDVYVQDQITDEDLNLGGVMDTLVPNLPFGADDLITVAEAKSNRVKSELHIWGPELAKMSAYAVLLAAPKWLSSTLDGVRVQPQLDKNKGIGTKVSAEEVWASKDEPGIGGDFEGKLYVRPATFSKIADRAAPRFVTHGINEGDFGHAAVKSVSKRVKDIQHPDTYAQQWGKAFLDEFAGSPTSLLFLLSSGAEDWEDELMSKMAERRREDKDELKQRLRREFIESHNREDLKSNDFIGEDSDIAQIEWEELPYSFKKDYDQYIQERAAEMDPIMALTAEQILDLEEGKERQDIRRQFFEKYYDWSDLEDNSFVDDPSDLIEGSWDNAPEEMKQEYREFVRQEADLLDEFKWDDLNGDRIGLSGMMMRGLDAESVIDGAKFLNVEKWLYNHFDHRIRTDSEEIPSFEEWEAEHFGPGNPSGPEQEARRRARFHKEVAAGEDAPNPYDALGVNEADRERIQRQPDDADPDDPNDNGLGDYAYDLYEEHAHDALSGAADRLRRNDTSDEADQ